MKLNLAYNFNTTNKYTNKQVRTLERTISRTLRYPEAKTMAFGGVATGNRKAKEAAIVQGIMK